MKGREVNSRLSRWKKVMALFLAASFIWNSSLPISYAEEDTAGVPLKDKYTGFDGQKVDWSYGTGDETLSYRV